MPVATKSANKSGFVRDFLTKHPEGNVRTVNEAWTAAGMEGTIGDTLIYATRADMGLSGKLRAKSKPKTAAKAKSPGKTSKAASSPGKTMFVKEYLNDHPQGNFSAVNKAWATAGFEGTISKAVVDKVRASLGLTGGNTRRNAKESRPSPTAAKPEQLQKHTSAPVATRPRGNQSGVLDEMEADIDRLIFKAMAVGDLTEIEDSLRRARRLLYTAMIKS